MFNWFKKKKKLNLDDDGVFSEICNHPIYGLGGDWAINHSFDGLNFLNCKTSEYFIVKYPIRIEKTLNEFNGDEVNIVLDTFRNREAIKREYKLNQILPE